MSKKATTNKNIDAAFDMMMSDRRLTHLQIVEALYLTNSYGTVYKKLQIELPSDTARSNLGAQNVCRSAPLRLTSHTLQK